MLKLLALFMQLVYLPDYPNIKRIDLKTIIPLVWSSLVENILLTILLPEFMQ